MSRRREPDPAERIIRRKPATYADVEATPEGAHAELIDGELFLLPAPRPQHQLVVGYIYGALRFRDGGTPGWVFIIEPQLKLMGGEFSCRPDIVGWKADRFTMPTTAYIEIVPDWICEVLSPSTRAHDVGRKKDGYERCGVRWLWHVDIDAQYIEVFACGGNKYHSHGIYSADDPSPPILPPFNRPLDVMELLGGDSKP